MRTFHDRSKFNIQCEPSRSCAVSTRYQQYINILLQDLDISPHRKLPNVFAEVFARYGASDYRGVVEEYDRKKAGSTTPLNPLSLDK